MAAGETEIQRLFRQVYRIMRRYGVENVIQKLRSLEKHGIDEFENEVINHIVVQACLEFKVTTSEIMAHRRRGVFAQARMICYVQMHRHLNFTPEQIAFYWQRNNALIYRALSDFQKLDPKFKMDQDLMKKNQTIEESVKKFIAEKIKDYPNRQI